MLSFFAVTENCLQRVYGQSEHGIDIINENIIYCQEFSTGHYSQVFMISILMFMIYFGMCILPFTKYSSYARTINENKSLLLTSSGREEFKIQINDKQERDLALDRYNGIPFHLYLIIHALLSIIYLLIKIILIFNIFGDEIDNRYKNINTRLIKNGFKSFVNAETIILTYLITHNISNIKQLTQITKSRTYISSDLLKKLMWICIYLIWIDVIFSLMLLCYKWSLIIFVLYEISVAIIYILLFIAGFCCIVPMMICFIVLIVSLFGIFGSNNCFGRFMFGLGSFITVGILGYLALCAMLCLIFVIVGGPYQSIIYLNWNDPNHKIVTLLFVFANVIGVGSVILGMFYECKDAGDIERHRLNINRFEYV